MAAGQHAPVGVCVVGQRLGPATPLFRLFSCALKSAKVLPNLGSGFSVDGCCTINPVAGWRGCWCCPGADNARPDTLSSGAGRRWPRARVRKKEFPPDNEERWVALRLAAVCFSLLVVDHANAEPSHDLTMCFPAILHSSAFAIILSSSRFTPWSIDLLPIEAKKSLASANPS